MSFSSFPIQTNPFTSYAGALTARLTFGCPITCTSLNTTGNIAFSGGGFTNNTTALFVNTGISGTDNTDLGVVPYNYINVSSDTASLGGGANSTGVGLLVQQNISAGALGQRAAIEGSLHQLATTNNNGPGTGNYPTYAAVVGNGVANANDNGTGTTSTTSSGNVNGGVLIAELRNGATDFYGCCGLEVDVACDSGSSVYRKAGVLIAQFTRDTVQGVGDDTALVIANQPSAVGWTEAIKIGNNQGGCLTTSGTVLRSGSASPMSCTNGIDLTNFTFSGNAYLSTGFTVSPTGIVSTPCADTTGHITFNGSTQDQTQAWFWQNGNSMSGTAKQPGSGFISPFQMYIGSDTVNTTTSGNGNLIGLSMLHAPAAGHTGGREALQAYLAVVGSPGGAGGASYVGGQLQARCNSNLGGSTGAYANYAGGTFAGNSNMFLQSGATFLKTCNSHEFDVAIPSGASAADKYGISIVKTASDAVRGAFDDTALSFNDQDGTSTTWTNGISFGSYAHKWSFGTDSTLIVVQSRQTGPSSTSVANYGIDFSNLTITTGGAGVVMPLITPSSSSATGKQGSIVWDANFIYICTATNTWKRAALSTF